MQQVFGSGGSAEVQAVPTQSFSLTSSWVRYTYTTTMASISGKTIGTSSYAVFRINFPLNSTFTVDIWGVQVEANYQPTTFEQRPIAIELAMCQSHYEKSYAQGTNPGTATDTGFILAMPGGAQAGSSGIHDCYFFFKVEKRTNPTMVIYDNAGNSNKCRRTAVGVANYDNQGVTDVNGFHNGCYFRSGSGSGSTNTVSCHFTASAEL